MPNTGRFECGGRKGGREVILAEPETRNQTRSRFKFQTTHKKRGLRTIF